MTVDTPGFIAAMTDGSRTLQALDRHSGWTACFRLWLGTGLLAAATLVAGVLLGALDFTHRR